MSDYKVKHDGHDHDDVENHDIGEDLGMPTIWGVSIAFFFFCIAISAWLVGIFGKTASHENDIKIYHSEAATLNATREAQRARLNEFTVIDADQGRVSVTIDEAKKLALRELINLQRNPPQPAMLINGNPATAANPCAAAEGENPCANDEAANPCAPAEGEPEGVALAEPGTARGAESGQH
ncbi:MAG: hypothetical protein H7A35_10190 [Planctomycetales bacterium]|nr:hypothetical protein [bacterium]UNM07241.1 MAG: hypothetical protein H7A35_10190 [Planctomycetales bacterium]